MTHFLLTYDRDAQRTLSIKHFDVPADALAAYASEERDAFLQGDRLEVVLFGADSEDQLRVSHARYFETADPAFT